MGLERLSGFAGLVGHGRSWGAWCTHGKPNGVFKRNWPKNVLALGKKGKHSWVPFVKASVARENVTSFMKSYISHWGSP